MGKRGFSRVSLSVGLLFVALVFWVCIGDSEDLPPFDETVESLRSQIEVKGDDYLIGALNNVSSLAVVSQTRGCGRIEINGEWISIEEHIKNVIRKELNRVVPHLRILDRASKGSAIINYELYMIRESRKFYHGLVKLHFSRPVVVVGTQKTISAVTWFDYIPFAVKSDDPFSEVGELAKFQARKFAAVWEAVARANQ